MPVGTAKISDPVGLHLRAASAIVNLAKRFPCDIRISYDGLVTNAKSILGLASLVARHGETLQIEAEGDEAEAALAALVDLIEVGLGQDSQPT